MQRLSRSVGARLCHSLAAPKSFNLKPAMSMSRFASTFSDREKGEEQRYFAALDAEKKKEMRAKLEAIIESNDVDAHAEVMKTLDVKDETKPQSMIQKLGLDDWKFALPVGMIVGIPTLANEVLVLSEETQIVAVFILFLSTVYTQLGPMIGQSLDDYRTNVAETLKKVDESMLVDIKAAIEQNEKAMSMEGDIKSVHEVIDEMTKAQADVLNYSEEHRYRDAVAKKLESLVAIEDSAVNAMKLRMLNEVKADVVNKFTSDAATKNAALAQAVAVLTAGKNGKMGKDIVGDAYSAAIKTYRTSYSKISPKEDAILVQLEKDIAAAVTAPAVEAEGGNVYDSHPVA